MKTRNMMLMLVFVLSISLILSAGTALAEENGNPERIMIEDADMMAGFDLPTVGWARANEEGEIIGYRGVNLGLGYSEKRYFEPMEFEEFNVFWGFGTVALILPYVEIGGDYAFAQRDDGSFFTVGAAVGLYSGRVSASYRF